MYKGQFWGNVSKMMNNDTQYTIYVIVWDSVALFLTALT